MPFQSNSASRYAYDSRRFVEIGMTIEPNTVWTYRQMAEEMGRPIDGSDQSLQHAIRVLARDHAREFKNIRKVGYMRLDDVGIVGEAGADRIAVGRKLRRASLRSSNIAEWDALADPLKREVDAHRAVINLLQHILQPRSLKRIRAEVDKVRGELALDETLQLFRRQS